MSESSDIGKFLRLLHPNCVFEIRAPKCPKWKGAKQLGTAVGYFLSFEDALRCVEQIDNELCPPAVYVSLNRCNPSLVAKSLNNISFGITSTSKDDIVRRNALLIDIDPVRPSGISSTQTQMERALALANTIQSVLESEGWPAPLKGMSGNGAYLIYRIDLANDERSEQLIKNCLLALDQRFSDSERSNATPAKVDTSTFDANRVCKVLGTMARKGSHVVGVEGIEDMPHRRSYFVPVGGPLEEASLNLLEALASTLQVVEKPKTAPKQTSSLTNSKKWIDQWIELHDIDVGSPITHHGGRKWIFNSLPGPCENHPGGHGADGSAFILERSDGAISAGCRHDRCKWDWADLRRHYEPPARLPSANDRGLDGDHPIKSTDSEGSFSDGSRPLPTACIKVTTPAISLLDTYFSKLESGNLPQLIKQRPGLQGIEIGPGLLTVIGAPPGTGKTAIAMQVNFDALALDPNLHAVIANAETSFDGLLRREFTRMTRIKSADIRFGNLTSHDRDQLREAKAELAPRLERMEVLDDPGTLAKLIKLLSEQPGLLVVDYLQKFAPPDKDARHGVGEVVSAMRLLAKSGWAVLCLSATSRTKEGKHDPKALSMSSFKESGEIEFNADSAYLLIDNGPLDAATTYVRNVTLQHVKNRHGAKVDHELIFNMPRMSFEAAPQKIEIESGGDLDEWHRKRNPFEAEGA